MDRRPAQAITARIDVANTGDPQGRQQKCWREVPGGPSRSGVSRDDEVLAQHLIDSIVTGWQ